MILFNYGCRNLYDTELKLLADPDYMQYHGADMQPKNDYIDQNMRVIVVSWLVEVAAEYELHQDTLFLAAALLDRFMSVAKVRSFPFNNPFNNESLLDNSSQCLKILKG